MQSQYMTYKPLIDYFDKHIVKAIDNRRVADLTAKWDEVFGPSDEEAKRAIYYDCFKWHIFNYEVYNCVEGRIAINQYLRRRSGTM